MVVADPRTYTQNRGTIHRFNIWRRIELNVLHGPVVLFWVLDVTPHPGLCKQRESQFLVLIKSCPLISFYGAGLSCSSKTLVEV